MTLKELRAKGIFKIKIELAGAFHIDPEKSQAVKKARAELASFEALVDAYKGGPDSKGLLEAQEGVRVWKAILAETLAAIAVENKSLAEYAETFAGLYLLMREPTGEEILGTEITDGKAASGKTYVALFPDCLIDWNIPGDGSEKASKEDVLSVVKESASLYAYVLGEWGASLPLARRSGRASIAPLAR